MEPRDLVFPETVEGELVAELLKHLGEAGQQGGFQPLDRAIDPTRRQIDRRRRGIALRGRDSDRLVLAGFHVPRWGRKQRRVGLGGPDIGTHGVFHLASFGSLRRRGRR